MATNSIPAGFPTNLAPTAQSTAALASMYGLVGGSGSLPAIGTVLPGEPGTGTGMAGAPQVNATNQSALGAGGTGGTQTVTNSNTHSSRSYSSNPYGFGVGGWGGGVLGWNNPFGLMPVGYGASMTGAAYLNRPYGGGFIGWLRRLFS